MKTITELPLGKPPLENESTEDLMVLSKKPSLENEFTEDLMALSKKPSLENEFTEDLMALFKKPSLENGSTEDLMALSENPPLDEQSEELESESLDGQSEELTATPLKKHIEKLKRKSLNNLSSYEILNLNKQASQEEINKRYKDLIQITHPDKGGDTDIFNAIGKAYRNLYKDKSEDKNGANDENNKEDEDAGLALIEGGYTPYISSSALLNLETEADQKELALLLGRQRKIYCKELISKYNGIDLKPIDAETINFNSVDLDSVYLSPENQEKILYLSQKANLSCHSLNGMQAITTEIVSSDAPGLYLLGWQLLHQKPGIDSGAVELFKTWNRGKRKSIAIELGNQKINHSEANIIQILDMHNSLKNPSIEQDFDRLIATRFELIASDLIRDGNINPTQEDIMFELHSRASLLPGYNRTIIEFVAALKKFNSAHSKDDNDWYQAGINIINSPGSGLGESAFSFLSPGAQRHVASELAKMSEGYGNRNPSAHNLISWANIQLAKKRAKDSGTEEMDLICSDNSPEPRYQAVNNEEENTFDEEGLKEQLALAVSKLKASLYLKKVFEDSQKPVGFMLTYQAQRTEPPVQRREICSNGSPKLSYQAVNNEENTLVQEDLRAMAVSRASRIPNKQLSFLANLSRKRSSFMLTTESQRTEPPAQRRKIG